MKRWLLLGGAILATSAMFAGSAGAVLITASTPVGSVINDLPVAASATFDITADHIMLTLLNSTFNPRSIAQNLSGFGFVLTTGETAGSLASSSGMERSVRLDGTYFDGSMASTGWELFQDFDFGGMGTGLNLNLLGTPTAPSHTLLGDPDAFGRYSDANRSIAGNDPHQPFLHGPVSFFLDVPGLTEDTELSGVRFAFNTAPGYNIDVPFETPDTHSPPIPEPGTLLLLGSGLLGAGVAGMKIGRRRV